ncbi:MAG: ABC transporter permease, partial [Roseobacter sp.]
MTDLHANSSSSSETEQDTVWEQEISLIDSVPRWIAMTLVFLVFIGTWQLVTSFGLVSPIILPTPLETLKDMIFVGQN